jgi:hypothetical protein
LEAGVSGIYHFEWRRDKSGYAFRREVGDGSTLATTYDIEYVEGLGGPMDAYWPLEDHPALWRQFAQLCVTREGIIQFANKFGLPSETTDGRQSEVIKWIIDLARFLAVIAEHHDRGERGAAVAIFNLRAGPQLTAQIMEGKKGLLELKPIPTSLGSAMMIQAAEALSGNYQFRRCRNCPEWLRLGPGSHSSRRKFCCDKCRVAFNRKMKRGAVVT